MGERRSLASHYTLTTVNNDRTMYIRIIDAVGRGQTELERNHQTSKMAESTILSASVVSDIEAWPRAARCSVTAS